MTNEDKYTGRKSLMKTQLESKTPATTAAVRKAAQASNREAALMHKYAEDHVDWLMKVARGDLEAPSAVQTLAVKTVNELLLGVEEERHKSGTDKVTINITGIGGPKDVEGITIEGESDDDL